MEKMIRNLGLLLLIQVALAVALNLSGTDLGARPPDTSLADFDPAAIDRLEITDDEGASVVLTRKGEAWVLPDRDGFPADATRVASLLDRLSELKRGLPVATSAGALKRFNVDKEGFERRVRLFAGEHERAVLYFGTSPGMRKVHARLGGTGDILSVAFSNHEAPVKVDDWIDRNLLQIPRERIAAITASGLTLTPREVAGSDSDGETGVEPPKRERIWEVSPLAPGERGDGEAAAKLAGRIADLRVDGLLAAGGSQVWGETLPEPLLTVSDAEAGEIRYHLAKLAEENAGYHLKVSNRPEVFRLPVWLGDQLTRMSRRDELIKVPEAEKAASGSVPVMPVEEKGAVPGTGEAVDFGSQPGSQ